MMRRKSTNAVPDEDSVKFVDDAVIKNELASLAKLLLFPFSKA